MRRKDARVRAVLFRKYGQIERDRVGSILHDISSRIVAYARRNGLGLTLEDISGVNRLYTKRAGHSRAFLRKRQAWPYSQIVRQILYKAGWHGIPVFIADTEYTSAECSKCEGRIVVCPDDSRTVRCSSCEMVMDRDENAARNILRRGLRSGLKGSAGEAMRKEQTGGNPTVPRADADQPAGSASGQDHR